MELRAHAPPPARRLPPLALRMQLLLGVSGASAYSTDSGASSPMKARQLSSLFNIDVGEFFSSSTTCSSTAVMK